MDQIPLNKRVLVTGAGGFIGSHLVEALVKRGAQVRAFVRYNSRADPGLLAQIDPKILAEVEVIAGDLRDLPAMLVATRTVDLIFHLGAIIAIPYSYQHPSEVVETNVLGTLNILLAARENQVPRVIHTSTSEVYGTAQHVPIAENHPLQGQSPYSASKIGADKLAESFSCAFNLPVITVRPFNTYGPRQSARAIIPTLITQALTQNVIKVGNLESRRDFTFVSDTVRGFLCAAETAGIEGQTFNLGTGADISIYELARKVISIIGRPVELSIDPQRLRPKKSEVMRLLSDNGFARRTLGWSPEVSLDSGLSHTVEWISGHLHLFDPQKYQV